MHAPTATQDPPLPTVTTAMPAPRVSTITDREELPKARKVGSAICGVYSCAASVSSVISMIPPPPPAPKQQIISSLLQLSHSDCLGSFPFCSTTITISLLVMCPATTAVSAVQVWLLLSEVPRWACTEMPYQEQFYIQKIQEPAPPPCPVFTCTREHSISILMSISITSALRGANLLKDSVGGRASSYFQQRRFIKPRDITCATIPSATTGSSPPSRGQTLRDQFKFWDRCSARHKSRPDNEFSSENPGQAQGEEQL